MKHQPKPLAEEHWHIQELIKGQQRRVEEREYARNQSKNKAARQDDINSADVLVIKDFWCHTCKEDFIAMSVKEVEQDWSNPSQNIARYHTKHKECGTWCIRHITDKLDDPFWSKSKAVALDRGKHSVDLLQPFENNYNLMWGKKK